MTDGPLTLVTGATGWLGRRLVHAFTHGLEDFPELSKTRNVRCLHHSNNRADAPLPNEVSIIEGDLTDKASLRHFFEGASGATLFHCAGIIHPIKGVKEFYDVNVEGTKNLLDWAAEAGIRRFIHVSSNSPIGCNNSTNDLFNEISPYNPYMNYGKSKMMAEKLVLEAFRQGKFETVIIRPPWFYGPGQPDRQTLFFKMIKEGKVPLLGKGNNVRSMAFIDNICQGLLLCEKINEANGQIYWIADKRPYPMKEILDTIERVMERDFQITVAHKRIHLPDFLGTIAEYSDSILQGLSLYNQKIHVLGEMNKNIACSIAKAEKELGYNPKIDLEEGMRRSIKWMLDDGASI